MLHRRLLVPIAVVPFAVGAVLTGTASAAPAPAPVSGFTTSSEVAAVAVDADATALSAATVKIVKGKWSKDSIRTHRTRAGVTCTAKNAGVIITNTTAVKQAITVGGNVVTTIGAHKAQGLCASSSAPISTTLKVKRTGDGLKAYFS